jgi:hypothetical protein
MNGGPATDRGILPGPGRSQRLLWAALSGVALVAVVLAVPLVLSVVGGSPFSHLVMAHTTRAELLHRSYEPRLVDNWLVSGGLLLAWISWTWMTVCVVLELRSRATGRSSRRLPASRTMQSVAACLVGTALAMSAAPRGMSEPKVAQMSVPVIRSGAGVVRVIEDLEPVRVGVGSDGVSIRSAGLGDPTAFDRYGEGLSTGPVYATELIKSEPIKSEPIKSEPIKPEPMTSGPMTSALTDQLIDGSLGTAGSPPHPSHVVRPRETLWSIAADRLGSARRWKEIAELNYGVGQADEGALTPEHWITPGWSLSLPQPAHAPTSDPPPSFADGLPRYANGFVGPTGESPINPAQRQLPLTPVGGGVVGAGVVNLLERMRRVQQRHRHEGGYIRLPDRSGREVEQRLRIGDGSATVHDVDRALRLLVRAWSATGGDAPAISGVRVHSDAIELVMGDGGIGDLPDPFVPTAGGGSFLIDRDALSDSGPAGREMKMGKAPLPLLATVGQGTNGVVMVNLETLGSLVVGGDPAVCEGVVRCLALEFATSCWAADFDLVLVGFGAELERFERVTSAPDVPSLIRRLDHRRIGGSALLEATGYQSFAHARFVESSDSWDPLVVICGPMTREPRLAELLEVASDPRLGSAIVSVGHRTDSSHVVTLSGAERPSSFDLLGSILLPQRIGPDELDAVNLLLDTASNRESVLSSDEPYVNLPVPMPVSGSEPDEDTPPVLGGEAHQVEVAVLGPVEIRGAAREFTRAWASELVIYLALHPNGASNEAWATALWPDRLMAPSSLHSTASVARRSLGQSQDGLDHLPRSHGRLALSKTVGTDWDRFVSLADSGHMDNWRSALELVRGRPFEGLRSSDWPILEGIGPAIEAAVVDLSGRLAGACLRAGDPRGAEWAARKGLLASPYDERLYRMLLRAADAAGNPAGVESVMAELIKLVADDVEPLDSVHPNTMDLYRSLTRRRAPTVTRR